MKKLFLLCVAIGSSLLSFAQFSGSGDGTESSPYLIYNETQLSQVGNFLNQSGVYFKLMKDLDLTDFISENYPSEGWSPIGVSSAPFKGVFDGNNHTISGVWIKKNASDIGFFGCINGATIQNLNLEGTTIEGANDVGALVGDATSSTITNCTSSFLDKIYCSSLTVGGMVGYAVSSTITNVKSYANVMGVTNVAGLVGCINSTSLSNIAAYGNIVGSVDVGGVIGIAMGGLTISNATFIGDISATSNTSAGIAAEISSNSSVSFYSCYSKATINNSGDYSGGIVGKSYNAGINTMSNCFHFGNIDGRNYIGGLIGASTKSSDDLSLASDRNVYLTEYKSLNKSSASYKSIDQMVYNVKRIDINNSAAIGNIKGEDYIGGLIGYDEVSLTCADWIWCGDISNTITRDNVVVVSSQTVYVWYNNTIVGEDTKTVTTGGYYTFQIRPQIIQTELVCQNSHFYGDIQGINYLGGIAGYKLGGNISKCYSNAILFGNSFIGGIIGYAQGFRSNSNFTLVSNVAINTNISANNSNIGRIYGSIGQYVTIGALSSGEGNRALSTTKVVLQGVKQEVSDNLQNGSSIGNSLLKLKASYVALGWDFNNDWDILETECYPYKKYQAAPPVITSELVSQATQISGSSTDGGQVYFYYKDNDAVSTTCQGSDWSFNTEPLQSGASVQLYAEVDGKRPSYFTTAEVGFIGKGTEKDPYLIYTAADLQGVYKKGHYKVMNDIDLTSWINENNPTEGWKPIGMNGSETVYIEGDCHKITGLWRNSTTDFTGLFSNFSSGEIKNLIVEVANGKQVKGGNYTGVLVGRNVNGKILNCIVKGDVTGLNYVGGVVGYSENNTLNTIKYEGAVSSSVAENAFVGGIAGYSKNDNISNLYASPTISSTANNAHVGGLLGQTEGGTVAKCHTFASITASGATNYVGGLIGYSQSEVTLSLSDGSINCSGNDSYTGGLIGYANKSIINCYSKANATGTLHTAGLCAYTFNSIENCYAKGDVSGVMYGAGVVSSLDGASATVSKCVALNNTINLSAQSSWGCRVIGGFRNGASEPGNDNYALSTMQVSLNGVPQKKTDDNIEGIAKSTSELKSKNFYQTLGWDMSAIWKIDEGISYPYFVYETTLPIITTKGEHGTITGGGTYEMGTIVTLTATADEHYTFVQWSDGVVSASRNIIVSESATYTAEFKAEQFTISASATNGQVTGTGMADYGTQVTLTVVPNDHYHFVSWSDGVTTASRTILVVSDSMLTAECAIDQHTITVNGENGVVTGSGMYEYGKQVTLTAIANEHYHFVNWSDGITTTSRNIIVEKDSSYIANFALDQYTISVSATNGTISGAGTYNYGTQVVLTATANEHYHFVKWSDGVTSANRLVDVTKNATYVAEFAIDKHVITVLGENSQITGGGTYDFGAEVILMVTPNEHYHFVQWSDSVTTAIRSIVVKGDSTLIAKCAIDQHIITVSGENGVVTGSGTYDYGKQVVLNATANEHYHFVNWTDGNSNASRVITVEGDASYTANFALDQFAISVLATNGSVTGAGTYDYGTQVTLTATANEHYHFVKWSDGVTTTSRVVNVSSNATYTAEFAIDQFTITANGENGAVTGGGTYNYGSQVTLTATANQHYHFVNWTDGNSNASRVITVEGDASYTANFALDQFAISVSATNGSVTGAGTYDYGTQVTLTATANEHYHFVQWSDGVTTASRLVEVSSNATYTAVFAIDQHTITVSGENGIVTGGGTYNYGQQVTLTATANQHYHFVNWTDGNSNASRVITVEGDASYTANFALDQYTITAKSMNTTRGNVTGGGTFDYNSEIVLVATPEYGYEFSRWSDGNTDNPRMVIVTKNTQYVAQFVAVKYTITAISGDELMGSVLGSNEYAYNTHATITAIPNEGYEFQMWDDGNTDNPRVVDVIEDAIFIATFVPTTGIEEISVEQPKVQKVMINDVLYIIREGKTYNAQGVIIE